MLRARSNMCESAFKSQTLLSVDKQAAAWFDFLLFLFYYPPFQHLLYYTTFYWKVSSNNNNNNNNRNTAHVECKNKGDTSNNRGDWDYFKVI